MLIRLVVWEEDLCLVIKLNKNVRNNRRPKPKKYSDFYFSSFGNIILEKELAILDRELLDCKRVLSVGCGPAVHEIELAKSNPDLTIICLDPSRAMLVEGRELTTEMNLLQGNAEQLPLVADIFDCVYFITSFEFIDDIESALTETSRVLRPGGKAIFLISNFTSWYFQKEYAEAESYFKSKIKHLNNMELEETIANQFKIISNTLELGINGEEIFDTVDPKWASLYVVSAIKPEVIT